MDKLLRRISACVLCEQHLTFGPRPVVQLSEQSKVAIIGQAPGRRVHETGVPWNDASGRTLRKWLGIQENVFYDPACFSIMSMGFCYPGKGSSGDLPPRAECARQWHDEILKQFQAPPLILLIGQYAQRHYLKNKAKSSLTETVRSYKEYLPKYLPLPHPSPRNQNWLRMNPWFTEEVIPDLRKEIEKAMLASG